jgi:riboflavin synthase
MFTGVVEAVGKLSEVKTASAGFRVRIQTPLAPLMKPGDSLAINGVCITVILIDADHVIADVGPQTARVTTLGGLQRGQGVNLERPMRPDGRMDGHFVQGHVDGVGTVDEIRVEGEFHWLTIGFPRELAPYLIRKGSIAVDGISLTVAGLGERQFDVMIIPYTWDHTSLQELRQNDKVNLECDMIGKYVLRAVELRNQS